MTNYWDIQFLSKLKIQPKIIFEVGARYGDETLKLAETFPDATIYSFECNPLTIDICKDKLKNKKNVIFINTALGDEESTKPFYSYIKNNDGCSSFLKRIDFEETQFYTGDINITTLKNIINDFNLETIDLLCMDTQGYELNILKGAEHHINKIKYVIMEEPKQVINTEFLPKNMYSKYICAPTPIEIKAFMEQNNFMEMVRIDENDIEDNVMYENLTQDLTLSSA